MIPPASPHTHTHMHTHTLSTYFGNTIVVIIATENFTPNWPQLHVSSLSAYMHAGILKEEAAILWKVQHASVQIIERTIEDLIL